MREIFVTLLHKLIIEVSPVAVVFVLGIELNPKKIK